MTTDRLVRARAEAERRYPGGQRRFTEANLQAAFRQGWLAADENHPAVEALARVRELHYRVTTCHLGDDAYCHHDGLDWPCATIKAIGEEVI